MNKKVIVFVMHELSVGGAERVVSNLVNYLDREEFEVHLCLFKKKGALVETLLEDVIIHDLKAFRVLTSGHKLFSLIVKLKPDIVFSSITHVNLLMGVFIPFLKPFSRHTRFITREVNIPSIRAKYLPKSKKLDRFYKRVIHHFDVIVAQSEYMKADILKSYSVDQNKVLVINNPLDIERIYKIILEEDVKEVLFEANKTNILAVGNLRRQKGFDILLSVMPLLHEKFHLTIIGEGKERALLEKQIDALGISQKVTLLGFQANPYKYMNKADIMVLSSRYEGFPNVILEANACGLFTLAFECPGVSHEIIQNDINGFLVEFEDVSALALAFEKYVNVIHDKENIVETTRRYNVENIVKEYEKVFSMNISIYGEGA